MSTAKATITAEADEPDRVQVLVPGDRRRADLPVQRGAGELGALRGARATVSAIIWRSWPITVVFSLTGAFVPDVSVGEDGPVTIDG